MASAEIPAMMRAVAFRKYCKPAEYEIIEVPVPKMENSDDVLVQVHAGSSTTGETQMASGAFRLVHAMQFPRLLGIQGSGVIVAVGSGVKLVKVGDEVYGGCYQRPAMPPRPNCAWLAEYTVAKESLLLPKPPNMSFEDAAAIMGDLVTAYQVFRRALELMGNPGGSLEGKTVFIPGALSSTGSLGCELAKNVFGAEKVISTVSTAKLPLVERYLGPGVVDQVVDYTKQDVVAEVGKGTVDVVYNTQWSLTSTFPLLNPKTGVCITIASIPPAPLVKKIVGLQTPFFILWLVTAAQWYYDWKLRGTNVKRWFISGHPENREHLEACGEIVAAGKVRPVTTVVDFDDLEAIRAEFTKIATGKGGVGKMVIKIR